MNLFEGTLFFNKELTITVLKQLFKIFASNPLDTDLIAPKQKDLLFKEVNFILNENLNGIIWNGKPDSIDSLRQQLDYIILNLKEVDISLKLSGKIELNDPVTKQVLKHDEKDGAFIVPLPVTTDLEGKITDLKNALLKAGQLTNIRGCFETGRRKSYLEIAQRLDAILLSIIPEPPTK